MEEFKAGLQRYTGTSKTIDYTDISD